jgi:hypothetical protein
MRPRTLAVVGVAYGVMGVVAAVRTGLEAMAGALLVIMNLWILAAVVVSSRHPDP